MSSLQARILVLPKANLRDPQGETILTTLKHMDLGDDVSEVTKGSLLVLTFRKGMTQTEAEQQVAVMCEKLLVNQLIERFEVEWIGA